MLLVHCDGLTDPSSHTNYMYLNTPEKNDKLAQLHKEKRKLSLRVTQLEQKLLALTDDFHSDVKKIADACTKQIYSTHPEGSFQRLFWDQQVTASEYKNSKSIKWHPLFIKWCLYLRHLSGKSYEQLQKSGCIKLPSQSTLRDYTHHIPGKVGFSAEVDEHIVDVAFLDVQVL